MAENKKVVLLYCDIIHTVEELTDEEAGKLFKHYLRYINDLNPVEPDKLTKIVFEPIKQNLKRDLKKWEETGQENEKWVYEQSHIGISHFSLFGWIFLMHIMGILKITDFITNAKKAGVQTATEAAFIINTAFKGPLQKVS